MLIGKRAMSALVLWGAIQGCKASRDRTEEPTAGGVDEDSLSLALRTVNEGDENQLVIITELSPVEAEEEGLGLSSVALNLGASKLMHTIDGWGYSNVPLTAVQKLGAQNITDALGQGISPLNSKLFNEGIGGIRRNWFGNAIDTSAVWAAKAAESLKAGASDAAAKVSANTSSAAGRVAEGAGKIANDVAGGAVSMAIAANAKINAGIAKLGDAATTASDKAKFQAWRMGFLKSTAPSAYANPKIVDMSFPSDAPKGFLDGWRNWLGDMYKKGTAVGDYAKQISTPVVIGAVGSAVAFSAYKAARIFKSGASEFGTINPAAPSRINLTAEKAISATIDGKNAVSSQFKATNNSSYMLDVIELARKDATGKFEPALKSVGNFEHGTAIIGNTKGEQLLHLQSNSLFKIFPFMNRGDGHTASLVNPATRDIVGTVHVNGPTVVFKTPKDGVEFLRGTFTGSKVDITSSGAIPAGINHDALIAALHHSAKWFNRQ